MRLRGLVLAGIVVAPNAVALAACQGTVLWSNPPDDGGGGDSGDGGGLPVDSGGSPDADAEGGTVSSLDCPTIAWPKMLAAPIVPLQTIANLNLSQGGPLSMTLAYGESVNCPVTPSDAGSYPSTVWATWGANADVSFAYRVDAPHLFYLLQLTGAYSGTLTFHSRPGGAYGNHQYVIGLNKLLRDGTPFHIDWTGTSATVVTPASIASATELFDGMMATFAPTYPVETDCYAAHDCIIVPDDLAFEANDGGIPSSAVVGFRPLKIYVQMPVGTSMPNMFYMWLAGSDAPDADAGSPPGMDAGGGIAVPSGCELDSWDRFGSCAQPVVPLCGERTTWVPLSCRDWPQSGYVVTCCPPDGG